MVDRAARLAEAVGGAGKVWSHVCHSDWPRDEPQAVEHARSAVRDTRRFGITLDLTGSFGITLRPCETAIYQKGVPDRISRFWLALSVTRA